MSRDDWGIGERGITPVIATILLIGLTIAAVSMVAVAVGQMQPSRMAPLVDLIDIRAEAVGSTTQILFRHGGGEPLMANELGVTIYGTNDLGQTNYPTSIKSASDNQIRFTDTYNVSTSGGEPYYPSGIEIEVFIVHDPTGTVLADVKTTVR